MYEVKYILNINQRYEAEKEILTKRQQPRIQFRYYPTADVATSNFYSSCRNATVLFYCQ